MPTLSRLAELADILAAAPQQEGINGEI